MMKNKRKVSDIRFDAGGMRNFCCADFPFLGSVVTSKSHIFFRVCAFCTNYFTLFSTF